MVLRCTQRSPGSVLAFWLFMKLMKSLLQNLLEALDDLKEVTGLVEEFA